MSQPSSDPGFGVYVHWPFCAAKCPYCDFNSHVRFGGVDEAAYLAAYRAEIAHVRALTGPRTVATIFFGGGTPSLMSPSTVAAILDAVAGAYELAPGAEITLEANPTSVEASRFAGYRAAGINRVSLGVQSLRDADLKALGRMHSAAEARAAIAIAARAFDRYSFDLIYARPGQSAPDWRVELTEALSLAGSHLSLYQLSIEPETPFAALHASGKLVVPDPDAALALYELTQELTAARGLPMYEISNHAAPGEESRHNLMYWRYGEYVGIGPGAHGRVLSGEAPEAAIRPEGPQRREPEAAIRAEGPQRRARNTLRYATVAERSPEGWRRRVARDGHGLAEMTPLSPPEEADEMLLMGLRLTEGLDLDRLTALTGLRPPQSGIDDLIAIGMLERLDGGRIRASRQGRFVLNAVVAKLAAAMAPPQSPETAPP